jgi:hypothetical protein
VEDTPTAHISAVVLSIILSQTLALGLSEVSQSAPLHHYQTTPNQEALKPNKLHTINKCYRWKESSVETYQNTIKQKHIQSLLDNFLDKKEP